MNKTKNSKRYKIYTLIVQKYANVRTAFMEKTCKSVANLYFIQKQSVMYKIPDLFSHSYNALKYMLHSEMYSEYTALGMLHLEALNNKHFG